MKKPLDIGALIDEKLKTKSNKFGWTELLEEIDGVLREQGPYSSKLVPGNIESLEENPRDPGNAQQIAYHTGMHGDKTKEIPDSDQVRWLHADKLAEADEDQKSDSSSAAGSSNETLVRVRVPDIFTMITNQNMGINDNDRKKINEIVVGIKGSNWKDRVKGFSEYIKEVNASIKPGTGKDDFREIISKLIFMTLLRKISLMTSNPGKLFEYILAPLIGSTARVVGTSDQEIVDVINDKGYAYQLKLFTGEKTDKTLIGSRNKFQNYVSGEAETLQKLNIDKNLWQSGMAASGGALTYIMSSADQSTNIVDFVEINVYIDDMNLTKTQDFIRQAYTQINDPTIRSHGAVFKDNSGKNFATIFMFEHPQQQLELIFGAKPQTSQVSKPEIPQIDFLGGKIPATDKGFLKFKSEIENIDNLQKLDSFVKRYPELDADFQSMLDQINIDRKSVAQLRRVAPATTDNIINQIKSKINLQALQAEIENKKTQAQQQTQTTPQITGQSSAQFSKLKPRTDEFNISLVSQWEQLNPIKMDLGNYKQVNEWQVETANIVQKTMVDVLNSFDSLGKNMTNYFGTATSRNTAAYGQECVNDARKITDGIISIGASEGDSIKE